MLLLHNAECMTSSQISSLNKRWTGHMQLRHTPISKKCHLSSPSNVSLLLNVLSPPVLTLNNSRDFLSSFGRRLAVLCLSLFPRKGGQAY